MQSAIVNGAVMGHYCVVSAKSYSDDMFASELSNLVYAPLYAGIVL